MADDIMKPSFEIPNEMRDFAEKSVQQARRAVETFLGAAGKAATTVDTSSSTLHINAKDMTTRSFSFAETNMSAAFDMLQKLVHAKGMDEVMRIQTSYMQSQMQALQEHASEFGGAMQKGSKSSGD